MKAERRRFLSYATTAMSLAALTLATAGIDRTAWAAGDPNAEVMQLQGTQESGPGSIDPRIGSLPQLKKPPLSAYNTYKLIDKKTQPAKLGVASSYLLANGRTLNVTLTEITSDKRYRVLITISEANAKDFLKKLEIVESPNEPFFLAGQYVDAKNPDKGGLILGITIRP